MKYQPKGRPRGSSSDDGNNYNHRTFSFILSFVRNIVRKTVNWKKSLFFQTGSISVQEIACFLAAC